LISPWIFNITIQPIIKFLESQLGTDSVAAYADDIVLFVR